MHLFGVPGQFHAVEADWVTMDYSETLNLASLTGLSCRLCGGKENEVSCVSPHCRERLLSQGRGSQEGGGDRNLKSGGQGTAKTIGKSASSCPAAVGHTYLIVKCPLLPSHWECKNTGVGKGVPLRLRQRQARPKTTEAWSTGARQGGFYTWGQPSRFPCLRRGRPRTGCCRC